MIQINDTTWINKGFIQGVEKKQVAPQERTEFKCDIDAIGEAIKYGKDVCDLMKNRIPNTKKEIEQLEKDEKDHEDKLLEKESELTVDKTNLKDQEKENKELENLKVLLTEMNNLFKKGSEHGCLKVGDSKRIEEIQKELNNFEKYNNFFEIKVSMVPGESYYEITFINGVKKEIKHPEEMQVVTDNILKAEA